MYPKLREEGLQVIRTRIECINLLLLVMMIVQLLIIECIRSAGKLAIRNERRFSETLYTHEEGLNEGLNQIRQDFEKLKIYAYDLS